MFFPSLIVLVVALLIWRAYGSRLTGKIKWPAKVKGSSILWGIGALAAIVVAWPILLAAQWIWVQMYDGIQGVRSGRTASAAVAPALAPAATPAKADLPGKTGTWVPLRKLRVHVPAGKRKFIGALPPMSFKGSHMYGFPNAKFEALFQLDALGKKVPKIFVVDGTNDRESHSSADLARAAAERRGKSGYVLPVQLPYNNTLSNDGSLVAMLYVHGEDEPFDLSTVEIQPSQTEQWLVTLDGEDSASFTVPAGFKHLWMAPIRDEEYLSQVDTLVIPPEGWGRTQAEVADTVMKLEGARTTDRSKIKSAVAAENEHFLKLLKPGATSLEIPYRSTYWRVDGQPPKVVAEDDTFTPETLAGSKIYFGTESIAGSQSAARILVGVSF